jgi:hypothetical protein
VYNGLTVTITMFLKYIVEHILKIICVILQIAEEKILGRNISLGNPLSLNLALLFNMLESLIENRYRR